MNASYLTTANDPVLWLLSLPLVAVVATLSISFIKKVKNIAPDIGLNEQDQKRAFRSGMISAIGPALGVFIVMLGLISKIGGPMAWQRLSIIGAAHTELTATEMAAQAMGTTLDGGNFGLTQFANASWVMALNGCGWLLVVALLTDKLGAINHKLTKGDTALTGIISVAGMCGAFAFLTVSNASKDTPSLVVAVVSGFSMILLNKLSKSYPMLTEYSLGIAMVVGMIVGQIVR